MQTTNARPTTLREREQPLKPTPDLLPAIVLAMFAGLVLFPLMFQPLWRDEGTTFLHADQRSIVDVLQSVQRSELAPPLYFLLEHVWVRIAGSSEFSLRLPSLLAVAAAVGFLYDAGRRVAGRAAGYVAAACACMTPLSLFVGTEARPYAMTMFLATLALWLVTLLLDEHRRPARIAPALAIVVAALCWTHYTAWPFVVALAVAAPAIGFGQPSNRRVPYLLAVLAGGATTVTLLRNFTSAARGSGNLAPDPVGVDFFHRIDARFMWFNPLLIAEPVFVALFCVATVLWLVHTTQSWPTKRLSSQNQLLVVCFAVVISGVSASILRSVPTHRHLAAFAPAAWLIIGIFYARAATSLGVRGDIRSLPLWRKGGLLILCALPILTIVDFPLTYLYERTPRSGSLPLVTELRRIAGPNAMLIAAPDAFAPSLKYYLDRDPSARLRGIPTWSQPWYYGYVRNLDRSQKRALLDRIERETSLCRRVAFAVDWQWKEFAGISYNVARDIVREESRLHGVAFHHVFPGTIETMDLVVLAPSCSAKRHPL